MMTITCLPVLCLVITTTSALPQFFSIGIGFGNDDTPITFHSSDQSQQSQSQQSPFQSQQFSFQPQQPSIQQQESHSQPLQPSFQPKQSSFQQKKSSSARSAILPVWKSDSSTTSSKVSTSSSPFQGTS